MKNGNPESSAPKYRLNPDDAPEAACAKIANGTNGNKTANTTVGILLSTLGAGGVATGAAVGAQTGHTPEYYGEWALLGAAGLALAATGIYFVTRGGSDHSEFWAANTAVALSRADYTQFGPPDGHITEADLRRAVTDKTESRDAAQNEVADATSDVTARETLVKTLQDAVGKRIGEGGGKSEGVKKTGSSPAPEPKRIEEDDAPLIAKLETAANALAAAQKKLNAKTNALAKQNFELAQAQGALAARQAAWNHCAAGMQAIGGFDAAANAAFAGAVSSAAGSKGSSGADKSSGGDKSTKSDSGDSK